MGYVVIGGMLAASFMGIFLIPVLFYIVERLTGRKTQAKKPAESAAPVTQPGVIPTH
jgi:HAE1 family hydrophobic/amphiphilic exporter-1